MQLWSPLATPMIVATETAVPDSDDIDLVSIVARCRAGDGLAWTGLDKWLLAKAVQVLGGYRLSDADRKDVGASARQRIVKSIQDGAIRGQTTDEIAGYIVIVIKNEANDAYRKSKKDRERQEDMDPIDLHTPGPSPESAAVTQIYLEKAAALIQSWPLKDRLLFLGKVQGVSSVTIREQLMRHFGEEISVATVDSRFSKLRKLLRESIGDTRDDEGPKEGGP